MENMREHVEHIKQTLRWFPGLVFGLPGRQIGKTTALLEVIHEDHKGEATVYCMNQTMALNTKQMYKDKFPGEQVPSFTSQVDRVRGRSDPIFADDWWNIPTADRRNLIGTMRLKARIGQEFSQRNPDATVIRFTDEELNCLDAMFDVIVTGGGNYTMIGLPEMVRIHRDLRRKFKAAKDEEV